MNTDPKVFLLKVLDAIGYAEDKANFIEQFLSLCYQHAIAQSVDTLPEEQQDKIRELLGEQPDYKTLLANLSQYVPAETFNLNLQKATQEQFKSLVESVLPTLSNEQKLALKAVLDSA